MPSTSAFNLDRHHGSAQTLDALHPLPLPTWFHQAEQDIASLLVHHRQSAAAATATGRSFLLHHPTASYSPPTTSTAVYALSNDSHDSRPDSQSHAVSCHDLYHPGFAAIQQVYRLLSALDRFNTSLTEHFFHSRFGIQRSCLYQLLHLSSGQSRPSVAPPPPSDNRSLHVPVHPGNVQSNASAALAAITTAANVAQGQGADIDTTDEPRTEPPKAPLVKGVSRRGIQPPSNSSTWATFDCSESRYPQVILPPPVPIPGPHSFAANANQSLFPMTSSPTSRLSCASHI